MNVSQRDAAHRVDDLDPQVLHDVAQAFDELMIRLVAPGFGGQPNGVYLSGETALRYLSHLVSTGNGWRLEDGGDVA